MARTVLVDSGVLVALVRADDQHHGWARLRAAESPAPWHTCEAVMSEAFFVAGPAAVAKLRALISQRLVVCSFSLGQEIAPVLALMEKYDDLPMSLADACLVRLTEILADPILLTTDSHFRVYRRHSRQVIPCLTP